MEKKKNEWWLKLRFPLLAGCSPFLIGIGFSMFAPSDDAMNVSYVLAACCGFVAGAIWRFWSMAGAVLAGIVLRLFMDGSHFGGVIVLLGLFALLSYLAGALAGVPAGYLLHWMSTPAGTKDAEEQELLETQNRLLDKK